MSETFPFWKELKAKFLREFTPSEQIFFLRKAREAATQKGYPAGEDLFFYCYFLTLKERLRGIDPSGGEGYMRFLLVETRRDLEQEIKRYEKRLEEKKLPVADTMGNKLIEYLTQ